MEAKRPFHLNPQVVLGILIIIVGVLITLDNLGLLYARDYLRYWPVLIMAYGAAHLFQPRGSFGRFGGLVWLLIGTVLLVDRLAFLNLRLADLWPLLLMLFGVFVIVRSWAPRFLQAPVSNLDRLTTSDDSVSLFAIMSGARRTITSQDFKGGDLTAIMGGCDLDLRQASISDGTAVISVFALWGGVDIKVPQDWTIIVRGFAILGGFDDKTAQTRGGTTKRLVVRGLAIMGGADVKN